MPETVPLVFLLDVDNTLLDNDRIAADLRSHLTAAFGAERQQRYWDIFEELRSQVGYADYLGALQRYRVENPHDPHFLRFAFYLVDYPFESVLYPHALNVIEHLTGQGTTVILSDGDVVFQPRKVQLSGLFNAVDGRVLIYIHKELEIPDIEKRFPAQRYVLIDDKLRILSAMKKSWGRKVTTVFPRQGHYAHDSATLSEFPAADITIDYISDLLKYQLDDFALK